MFYCTLLTSRWKLGRPGIRIFGRNCFRRSESTDHKPPDRSELLVQSLTGGQAYWQMFPLIFEMARESQKSEMNFEVGVLKRRFPDKYSF